MYAAADRARRLTPPGERIAAVSAPTFPPNLFSVLSERGLTRADTPAGDACAYRVEPAPGEMEGQGLLLGPQVGRAEAGP